MLGGFFFLYCYCYCWRILELFTLAQARGVGRGANIRMAASDLFAGHADSRWRISIPGNGEGCFINSYADGITDSIKRLFVISCARR